MNPRNWFHFMPRLFRRTEYLIRHPDELLAILTQALGKAYAKRLVIWKVFEDFLTLFRLVKAWVMRDYVDVPTKSIFWAIFAIVYFLSPIDLIPDFLPGGYIDDIFVISYVVKKIKVDLEKFEAWEKQRKKK